MNGYEIAKLLTYALKNAKKESDYPVKSIKLDWVSVDAGLMNVRKSIRPTIEIIFDIKADCSEKKKTFAGLGPK